MNLLRRVLRFARQVLALAAFSVVVAVCVAAVWSWPASWQPWYPFLRNFGVETLFVFLIAATAWSVFRTIPQRLWRCTWLRWPLSILVLLVSAAIGSAAGSLAHLPACDVQARIA